MKKRNIFLALGALGVILTIIIIPMTFSFVLSPKSSSVDNYRDESYSYIEDSTSPSLLMGEGYSELKTLAPEKIESNREGLKVQKNGSITLLVEDLDSAVTNLKVVNNKYQGQITNILDHGRGNDRVVQITIKIPVNRFEEYYETVREIDGEVTYANISILDVTEEYIDIASRLTNLKNTEVQFTKILEKAETITDILAVQRELNTVRGEIESYEQRMRYFDNQTEYSHINITFSVDKTGISVADEKWRPWGEVKVAVKALLTVLKSLVDAIIWLVVFSPLVLIPYLVIRYLIRRRKAKKA